MQVGMTTRWSFYIHKKKIDMTFDDSNLNKRRCEVCGSQSKRLLFQQRFSTMSSGSLLSGYDVVACQDCGFCFADGIPGQEAFGAYYEKMSKYEHQDSGGQESVYDLERFQEVASVIRPFLTDRQTRILEVGCATGRLLALLKESGFSNVLGVDPSPSCAKAAHRLYGVRVVTARLSDAVFPEGPFDFIITVGVLEHVRDLRQALACVTSRLASQGQLYVAVPDASRYARGEDAPFQEFSVEHINFFGPVSLTSLLRKGGLSLISCQQAMVQANYRTTTPSIHAVFKKDFGTPSVANVARDTATESGLKDYIDQSRRREEHVQAVVDGIVRRGQPIIVWGTGSQTLRLLETGRLKEARIHAFVDSNPQFQGRMINGVPIINPGALSVLPMPILISSRVFQNEIHERIVTGLNLKNQVITLYQHDNR